MDAVKVWSTPIRDDIPGQWNMLEILHGDSLFNLGLAFVNAGGDINTLGGKPRKPIKR